MQQFTPKQTIMALFVPLLWGLGFVFAKGAINHFPPILLMALSLPI
jgi:O-acetylserine/cysteine efflux transporter